MWDTGKKILSNLFHKDFVVGLDIGSSSIKLVQLVKREMGLILLKTEHKDLSHLSDPLLAEQEKLRVLKEILQVVDKKKSKFVICINDSQTGVRAITAPHMPLGELREAIRFESKNYFPFAIEESLLDFEMLGEVMDKGVKKYRVGVAVSPRKTIDDALSLLKKVGIKPVSIVPVPLALQKLGMLSDWREDKTRCFVEMGERYTELIILKERNLFFSRKIPVAGSDFTKALTGILISDRGRTALTLDEAEKIKWEIGVPSPETPRVIDDKISTEQIISMLHSPLEQLVSEIDRCFDYYQEETGGEKVSSMILFGRGAGLKGLDDYLSRKLGVEVKVGNPLEQLKMEAQMIKPEEGFAPFAGALGAALSEGKGINLLPPEIKEETQRAFKRATIQSVAVATILILGFLYTGMEIQLSNFKKRIEVAKFELTSLRSEIEKASAQSVAHQVMAEEPYWEDVFKEISNVVPQQIFLTELAMGNQTMTMKGVIVSQEKEGILSHFILNLEQGIFKDVKLVTSRERPDKSASEFELEFWVD